ncbi:alpha-glucoside transport system permease protein [Nocardioides sp. BE266]|uniref:carbohydrate ABC transporter permease n=1 Tax=Nocardioides sp. BE266 TaxID=2817725 RepID=UPI002859CB9F|nr:sugar ABC transporter permease [Nocardioides sp. BE266]MDR7252560.1 alpha-glucoside transport system permease protein [Nocardioides sp. BE266]
MIKLINALLTVLAGIGAAVLLYYVLNKIAELLPEKLEARVKPYLYILPAYLAITVYLIYPAVATVLAAFRDRRGEAWVGFANFTDLFDDNGFLSITLFNSLLWVIIVPAATVILGLLVAVLADKLSPRGEKLSKSIIFLPMAISAIGASVIWNFVYESRATIGLQNAVIGLFGAGPIAWLEQNELRFNSILLMIVLMWMQVGFSMVLLSSAIKGVPAETLEAARIDGANERAIFFRVVVPQIKGTIITVFITVTIGVMKVFDIVYVMTNGGFKTNVLANEFWNQLSTNFNNGKASAIVVLLMLAVMPILFYQVRHFKAEEAAR